MKRSLLASLVCLFSLGVSAQDAPVRTPNRTYDGPHKLSTWSISIIPQHTRFFGDLSYGVYRAAPELGYKEILTGGLGLSINKQLSNLLGVSVLANAGMLSGSKRQLYNAYFRTQFGQVSLLASINLKAMLVGTQRLKHLKWDVYGGVGNIWFDARVYDLNTNRLIRYSNDRPEFTAPSTVFWQGSKTQYTREWAVPVGTVFSYELSPHFDLGLDIMYNNLNTEKLDMTVGSTDPNFNSSPMNIFGFRKGESSLDKYGAVGLSITYKIGRKAVRAKRDEAYDPGKGQYNLRWTNPDDLTKPTFLPTVAIADSVAKANMPKPVDPRLYRDSDDDGVADLFDKEPRTPTGSVVSGAGVAINLTELLYRTAQSREVGECEGIVSNIEFDTDRATIRPASQDVLEQVVTLLNARPNCRVIIVGHADARASEAYNMQLSKRRVEAAKRFMVRAGLTDPERITLEYYGEIRPIMPNSTASGLQSNRRVEIKVEPMSDLNSRYPAGFRKR